MFWLRSLLRRSQRRALFTLVIAFVAGSTSSPIKAGVLDFAFDTPIVMASPNQTIEMPATLVNNSGSPILINGGGIADGLGFAQPLLVPPGGNGGPYQITFTNFPISLAPNQTLHFNFGTLIPDPATVSPGTYGAQFEVFQGFPNPIVSNLASFGVTVANSSPSFASIISNSILIQLSNDSQSSLPTVIQAAFSPNFGLTIDQAAAAGGFVTFDWIQRLTNLPDPSPYTQVGPPTVQLTSASTPFNDPPLGGYTSYLINGWDWNSFPVYWDLNSTNQPWSLDTHLADKALFFFDAPTDPCLPGGGFFATLINCGGVSAPPGSYLGFQTDLAGILADGSAIDLGIGFTWIDTFSGSIGGIATTASFLVPDSDGGTGGITITGLNNASVVPEPSALIIFISSLVTVLVVRKRTEGARLPDPKRI